MEIEKYTVPCLIEGNIRNVSIDIFEDDLCRISFENGNDTLSSAAENYWDALIELRKKLEAQNIKLFCKGCAKNVYPSPMILDMGDARRVYKLTLGQHASMKDLVFIFAPCDPDEYATIKEQETFYKTWIKGGKNGE